MSKLKLVENKPNTLETEREKEIYLLGYDKGLKDTVEHFKNRFKVANILLEKIKLTDHYNFQPITDLIYFVQSIINKKYGGN